MLKIVICEDQLKQQEILKTYINKILREITNDYEILTFASGEELLENYPENIDIFLLDIQMDKLDGMEIAKKIREIDKKEVEIIFTTSLVKYIQEGYEVRAYRYLLKPIKFDDLKKHLASCIKEINDKKDNYIVVNGKNDVYKINVNHITYVEIQNKDMTIHTIDQDYNIKMSIDKIEKELSRYNFFRCHKSFLVNIIYIENIKQYVAILENEDEVPISRHRFKETKAKFLSYIGSVL